MMNIITSEMDTFMITYDEPNAEEHWVDLLNKVPWAKRVHGVKGFDAAHKACADQSETSHFITVDGDNKVRSEFFEQTLDITSDESIYSWNAKNHLNGLVYGNGGIKCWPKEYALSMKTHEAADDSEGNGILLET